MLSVNLKTFTLSTTLLLCGACDPQSLSKSFGETALGVVYFGVKNTLTGAPCREGNQRVFVQRENRYGRNETKLETVYVECDEDGQVHGLAPKNVATTYNIHEPAAYTFLETLRAGSRGDVESLKKAGLEQEDILLMARFKLPRKESIQKLAQKINIPERELKRVLKKMLKDAQVLARSRGFESQTW